MILNIDLLGLPGAELTEVSGVKGIFIPEVPNFRRIEKRSRLDRHPEMAVLSTTLYPIKGRRKKYSWAGKLVVQEEHRDMYLANPKSVGRLRFLVYGYSGAEHPIGGEPRLSSPEDFDKILND